MNSRAQLSWAWKKFYNLWAWAKAHDEKGVEIYERWQVIDSQLSKIFKHKIVNIFLPNIRLGAHKNRLIEIVLLSTQSLWLRNKKNSFFNYALWSGSLGSYTMHLMC